MPGDQQYRMALPSTIRCKPQEGVHAGTPCAMGYPKFQNPLTMCLYVYLTSAPLLLQGPIGTYPAVVGEGQLGERVHDGPQLASKPGIPVAFLSSTPFTQPC